MADPMNLDAATTTTVELVRSVARQVLLDAANEVDLWIRTPPDVTPAPYTEGLMKASAIIRARADALAAKPEEGK